ncbi:unnamed protein product [Pseudo-nitzschia multistriata]|uniref:Uncharacterized protein n=1 Tax=Pseudo-nitzschia multistriata TaxID=183589 RepID=A0A448YXL2_9STRA|nr:unnamed protein product [Pseudo-nitzschia multistriata]
MHPQLLRKLSKPSKVASILDWKKASDNTVLALNIHKNRVGIAVASHPSLGIPCIELDPLRFDDSHGNRTNISRSIDRHCLERFSDIIEDYKVCGVVVNWPLQHDTGRMGAACGRVIFALEQLVERSNESTVDIAEERLVGGNAAANDAKDHDGVGILSRPFCLWDAGHIDVKQRADPSKRVDAFGRCASYGREAREPPVARGQERRDNENENTYFASKEQYYEDELTVVLGVWDDFCREHWPDLYETRGGNAEGILGKADGAHQAPASPSNDYGDSEPATPEKLPIRVSSPRLQNMAKMKQKKCLITMR